MAQSTEGQHLDVGGLTIARGGKIKWEADGSTLQSSGGALAITGTTFDPTVSASRFASGDRLIAGFITQSTSVALTGTLDGIYMRATGGDTGGAGTIRGAEIGARLDDTVTSAVAAVVTGGYFWADAKTKEATILRGLEVSLDGGAGGTSTTAQGLVIFNNSSAVQTTSIGVDINGGTPSGHKAFTSDIRLQNGETIDNATDGTVAISGRIDLSGVTVATANTDGGTLRIGTSASPVTKDTADMKFISCYFDDGATSGDARGIYNRLYITGAGGGGESLRTFTTVSDVAGATAHGAHTSLSFGTSGKVTGQGIASRNTLQLPSTALPASNVTYAPVESEIWSDAATSDPAGNLLSCFLVGNNGDTTGAADVDDDAALFDFRGWTVADGNMIAVDGSPGAAPNITHSIRVRLPDGSYAYLYLGATPVTA